MEHNLVNPNHICSYRINVQYNPFVNYQIFVSMEYHGFSLLMVSKVTVPIVSTTTPTD